MKTRNPIVPRFILSLSVLLIFPGLATAETTSCTPITSLPYTVDIQGVYCLTGDLSTDMASGHGITIGTNNVVVDLNGYTIAGLAAGAGTEAYGIYVPFRQNITIRNGTVRGFNVGIYLNDVFPYTISQAHVVENILADMNTVFGILAKGRGNTIRNNQVVDTGGASSYAFATGVEVVGPGNRVINNDVQRTRGRDDGFAYGISADTASGVVIENNRVLNAELGPGTSFGVYLFESTDALVKDNTVSLMNYGIYYNPYGMGSTGIYINNLAGGCTIPFTGGTSAGSTNYSLP